MAKYKNGMRCEYVGDCDIIKGIKMTITKVVNPGEKTHYGERNNSDQVLYSVWLDEPMFCQYEFYWLESDLAPINE